MLPLASALEAVVREAPRVGVPRGSGEVEVCCEYQAGMAYPLPRCGGPSTRAPGRLPSTLPKTAVNRQFAPLCSALSWRAPATMGLPRPVAATSTEKPAQTVHRALGLRAGVPGRLPPCTGFARRAPPNRPFKRQQLNMSRLRRDAGRAPGAAAEGVAAGVGRGGAAGGAHRRLL